jgi:homoserine O-acetyltransferase/O-succinyltransferase
MIKTLVHNKPFTLQNGNTLPSLTLAYTVMGDINTNKKIVWVFHALTANSDASLWWKGLVGENDFFNPNDYTIVCVNIPGSCYGSSGPLTINENTNDYYYNSFPVFSVVDIVKAFQLVKDALNITSIYVGIGGSMGGQHLLQWAAMEPNLFKNIIPIACNSIQSAFGLAIDAAQRLAIEADCTWNNNTPTAGINGLKAARAMAMVTYRTYDSFAQKNTSDKGNAETYQRYQAQKITERFNAYSYYNLSLSRNTHNVENDLYKINARTLVIGINTDQLMPLTEQQHLANNIKNATLVCIDSVYGHDAFLVETIKLTNIIKSFLDNE